MVSVALGEQDYIRATSCGVRGKSKGAFYNIDGLANAIMSNEIDPSRYRGVDMACECLVVIEAGALGIVGRRISPCPHIGSPNQSRSISRGGGHQKQDERQANNNHVRPLH